MKTAPRDESYFWAYVNNDFILAYGNIYGFYDQKGTGIRFEIWRNLEKPTL